MYFCIYFTHPSNGVLFCKHTQSSPGLASSFVSNESAMFHVGVHFSLSTASRISHEKGFGLMSKSIEINRN